MYPMTDPRRKSLRGAPWDGPSLTCYKKRSPNMGTKTYSRLRDCAKSERTNKKRSPNMGTKTSGRGLVQKSSRRIKKDPQTWGRKQQ